MLMLKPMLFMELKGYSNIILCAYLCAQVCEGLTPYKVLF